MLETIAERVLDELRIHGPLDDDQLAHRLRASSRQAINQVCRRLVQRGLLHRYSGPDGKLVNDVRQAQPHESVTETRIPLVVEPESPAGHSREQREAEQVMLGLLSVRLGTELRPRRILLDDGVWVAVDGADAGPTVLVEAWAHHGTPKSAQKHKVLADVLKLLHAAKTFPTPPELVLCLCDADAARHFTTARSWAAHALRGFGVRVEVVDLPADLRASIRAAQQRQFR